MRQNESVGIGMLLFWCILIIPLFWFGCVESATDGQVHLDPVVAEQVEDVGEGAVGILTALSPLFPWLIPFATGGGGLLAMYKRLKPKLTTAENKNTSLVLGGEILSIALQDVKDNHPAVWEKVGPLIKTTLRKSVEIENAVREFRSLMPKV